MGGRMEMVLHEEAFDASQVPSRPRGPEPWGHTSSFPRGRVGHR